MGLLSVLGRLVATLTQISRHMRLTTNHCATRNLKSEEVGLGSVERNPMMGQENWRYRSQIIKQELSHPSPTHLAVRCACSKLPPVNKVICEVLMGVGLGERYIRRAYDAARRLHGNDQ
jgi:hypothetical protein